MLTIRFYIKLLDEIFHCVAAKLIFTAKNHHVCFLNLLSACYAILFNVISTRSQSSLPKRSLKARVTFCIPPAVALCHHSTTPLRISLSEDRMVGFFRASVPEQSIALTFQPSRSMKKLCIKIFVCDDEAKRFFESRPSHLHHSLESFASMHSAISIHAFVNSSLVCEHIGVSTCIKQVDMYIRLQGIVCPNRCVILCCR